MFRHFPHRADVRHSQLYMYIYIYMCIYVCVYRHIMSQVKNSKRFMGCLPKKKTRKRKQINEIQKNMTHSLSLNFDCIFVDWVFGYTFFFFIVILYQRVCQLINVMCNTYKKPYPIATTSLVTTIPEYLPPFGEIPKQPQNWKKPNSNLLRFGIYTSFYAIFRP